mmetsp:Transcript_6365/g.16968  ORF Transcript_6365/g.16968 Transcript_6365/m.16968 type:complete len:203 (-) Transcript_6365:232-840(-)
MASAFSKPLCSTWSSGSSFSPLSYASLASLYSFRPQQAAATREWPFAQFGLSCTALRASFSASVHCSKAPYAAERLDQYISHPGSSSMHFVKCSTASLYCLLAKARLPASFSVAALAWPSFCCSLPSNSFASSGLSSMARRKASSSTLSSPSSSSPSLSLGLFALATTGSSSSAPSSLPGAPLAPLPSRCEYFCRNLGTWRW